MIQTPRRGFSLCVGLIALMFMFPMTVSAQDADKSAIVGVWNATADSENGERSSVWTFELKGDEFAGHYVSSESDEKRELSNISFDGKELKFDIELEAQGQQLVINVESKLESGKLSGSWSANGDGSVLASGNLTAVKKVAPKFDGNWNTTASLPDGETLESSLLLTNKNGSLSGTLNPHGEETKIDKASVKGKMIRMEFKLDVEGDQRNVVIEAELKAEDSLKGKWILLDDAGDEEVSGDWSAAKAKPAKQEKKNKPEDSNQPGKSKGSAG